MGYLAYHSTSSNVAITANLSLPTKDYHFYLEKLEEAFNRHSCELHAYVLMTNHAHLLITPEEENGIGKVMQSLKNQGAQTRLS